MSYESKAVHMSHLLRAQVLYFKCRCATSAVIIEDFLFMHTVGQPKPLSLAHEEGDPNKMDFGGAGSGSLFCMHTGDRLEFTSLKNTDLHYTTDCSVFTLRHNLLQKCEVLFNCIHFICILVMSRAL